MKSFRDTVILWMRRVKDVRSVGRHSSLLGESARSRLVHGDEDVTSAARYRLWGIGKIHEYCLFKCFTSCRVILLHHYRTNANLTRLRVGSTRTVALSTRFGSKPEPDLVVALSTRVWSDPEPDSVGRCGRCTVAPRTDLQQRGVHAARAHGAVLARARRAEPRARAAAQHRARTCRTDASLSPNPPPPSLHRLYNIFLAQVLSLTTSPLLYLRLQAPSTKPPSLQ
ncbi:unnamed protein product, partial [Iphiclides podalirius]